MCLIDDVATFLGEQVAIRPEYLALRTAFIEIYGASGVCNDPLAFFLDAGRMLLRGDWASVDKNAADGSRHDLALPQASVTAFVQFAINEESSATEDRAVVNRVFECSGWLTARHIRHSPCADRHARQLRAWLGHCASPGEPVDMPISGSCNDLQAHRPITQRTLVWPGEPACQSQAELILLSDTCLRIDDTTGFIELVDRDGQVIKPTYLGSSQPMPSWGPQYAALLLAMPAYVRRPRVVPTVSESPLVAMPRRMFGKVVLSRAQWAIDTRLMLEILSARRDGERLLSLHRFFEEHGIPAHTFVQAQQTANARTLDLTNNDRKPMYQDIGNPLCIDGLKALSERCSTLLLSEVFPTSDFAMVMEDGSRHVAEFQFDMLISPTTPQRRSDG